MGEVRQRYSSADNNMTQSLPTESVIDMKYFAMLLNSHDNVRLHKVRLHRLHEWTPFPASHECQWLFFPLASH